MGYRVQVRINKSTGVIELFQVDDTGVGRQQDHDAAHDEFAQAIGELVERRAEIEEVRLLPGTVSDTVPRLQIGEEQVETDTDGPERLNP